MGINRVKARQKGVTGYINCMRGTWLGNPFPLNKYSLEESLALYQEYLLWRIASDLTFREYLRGLRKASIWKDITLGCTCNLHSECHVDILIEEILDFDI